MLSDKNRTVAPYFIDHRTGWDFERRGKERGSIGNLCLITSDRTRVVSKWKMLDSMSWVTKRNDDLFPRRRGTNPLENNHKSCDHIGQSRIALCHIVFTVQSRLSSLVAWRRTRRKYSYGWSLMAPSIRIVSPLIIGFKMMLCARWANSSGLPSLILKDM